MTLPSVRYHRTEQPRVIHTPEQHDELEAAGWAETPAAFDGPEPPEPEPTLYDDLRASFLPAAPAKRKR